MKAGAVEGYSSVLTGMCNTVCPRDGLVVCPTHRHMCAGLRTSDVNRRILKMKPKVGQA